MRCFKSLSLLVLSAFGGVLLTAPGHALTVATQADLTASLAAGRFGGVGSLGVFVDGRPVHACTASLLSANVVLTAAHCVGASGPLDPRAKLLLPAAGDYNLTGGAVFTLASAQVLKSYNGIGNSDIALITLRDLAQGYTTYDIYTDHDEIGKVVTLVGAGMSGTMAQGASPATSDYRLRAGKNRYDLLGPALGADQGLKDDILLMDNDDGTAEHDLFGRFLGTPDRGVFEDGRLVEAGLIFGDSGGPDFIGNRIAGVHSFATTGMYLDPAHPDGTGCGLRGSVDAAPPGPLGCTDGSFGDLAGSIRVSYYADAIRSYVAAAAVPEPSAWALMLLGFGAAGATLRRQDARRAMPG